MNYIGSKLSLLPEIERVLDMAKVPREGVALDIFAGTAVVAQSLKKRGHTVYANDWQYYSYITAAAFIECSAVPSFEMLLDHPHWFRQIESVPLLPGFPTCSADSRSLAKADSTAGRVLSYLSQMPGSRGPFYEAYCEGGEAGRQYYSKHNGMRIQAIRDQIELWSSEGLVNPVERAWLIASLLEGADRVANTASVYGAFLKHVKMSARKPLQLYMIQPAESADLRLQHRAFCEDSEKLLRDLQDTPMQLVYVDPPYNSRQYSANYHVLETIARWDLDMFEPRGVTGLRPPSTNRSDYCLKPRVEQAFRRLLTLAPTQYLLFSYNNEGLVPRDRLEALFRECCSEVWFEEIQYKRFRADNDSENRRYKGDATVEFLVLGKLCRQDVHAADRAVATARVA